MRAKDLEKVQRIASDVKGNAPTSAIQLMNAGRLNNCEMYVTDDPNEKPSQEQIDQKVNFVRFKPSESWDDIGHYVLIDKNGDEVDIPTQSEPGSNNCGYEIVAYLTGKTTQDIRNEVAEDILRNPEKYLKIEKIGDELKDRYPDEANDFMKVGGFNKFPIRQSSVRRQREIEMEKLNKKSKGLINPEHKKVRQLYWKGKERKRTSTNRSGWVYLMTPSKLEGYFKAGMTNNLNRRKAQLSKANQMEFDVVKGGAYYTHDMHTAEKMLHHLLKSNRVKISREQLPEGRTEIFIGDPADYRHYVLAAVEFANNLY